MRLAISLLSVSALLAADPPKAPTIPVELRARFWRTVADATTSQAQAEKAQAALDQARAELVKACGDAHQLAADAQGEPVCVEKPKPEAAKEKK